MDGKLNIFEAIARRMTWLGQRQRVLAQNIANADTPDFIPQDLKHGPFEGVLRRSLSPVQPAATHPDHLQGASKPVGSAEQDDQSERFETAPSGNSVVLEQQLINVSETQMDYQTMTNLYRKHAQMLRMALGRGGS